jgi:hypothetical protein
MSESNTCRSVCVILQYLPMVVNQLIFRPTGGVTYRHMPATTIEGGSGRIPPDELYCIYVDR